MTDSRLLKYQSLLLEGPVTKLKVCGNLNPATFLPEKENETPDHDCSQFLTLNYAAWKDLKDTPLDNPDMEIFTDGSSFVQNGQRKAGYAVVTAKQVWEAKSLPQGTSAQLAELVALTRALELSKGQRVNIYKDSKYAYLTLHAHAAIWKERHFKTATGEPIKHFREIERLLTAIYCPKEVAVTHCKGHSRDGSKIAQGNHLANCQARKAALYETP
jgi:ribonuclease HI